MNIEFLDPFENTFPNKIEAYQFHEQRPYSCSFNGTGTYLAMGTSPGPVFVVDFATWGIIRELLHHTAPVTAVR